MKKSAVAPLISVCIPLYDTEPYLAQCLRSALCQDFASFELVIVSDASRGRDEKGRRAKKIIRLLKKESDRLRKAQKLPPIPVRFVEHRVNLGLVEVRRTLCREARGLYITQLDSDDEMEEGALSALYAATGAAGGKEGVDIVHGRSRAGTFTEDGSFVPADENRNGNIFLGDITGRDVFRRWLLEGAFTANTWGKLIKRELWLRAYADIPFTQCNLADDLLVFFFLAQYAASYRGIAAKVYRYRITAGMTSARKIDSLHRWKMLCSAASVFTVIFQWITEHDSSLLPDEVDLLRKMMPMYLANNLRQLSETVIPSLRPQARDVLCDYWGESFVGKMEAMVQGSGN